MSQQETAKRLVMELEQQLRCDQDGSLQADINKQLDEIDTRLNGEAKKLQPKKMHQEIAAARQAVQGAVVALELIQAIRN